VGRCGVVGGVLVVPTDDWEDGERKIPTGFSFGAGVTDSTESKDQMTRGTYETGMIRAPLRQVRC
jgi:hypothetical protein